MKICPVDAETLDGLHAYEMGLRNVKQDGAVSDGVTNDNAAILAAIAAGYTRLFLPDDTLWTPTSNLVPGNVEYWGGNWETVIIKAANPDTQWITIGPRASLHNMGIWDRIGFDNPGVLNASGSAVNNTRPFRHLENIANEPIISTHWSYMGTVIHAGVTGIDQPGFTVNGKGNGDCIFVGAAGNTVGIRLYVNDSTAPTGDAKGILVQCFGNGPGIQLQAETGSVLTAGTGLLNAVPAVDATSVAIGPTVATTTDLLISTAAKVAGQMINLFQTSSVFTGIGMAMNFASSFTGQFLRLQKNSVDLFSVDSNGTILVGTPTIRSGAGSPEGVVTASVGSHYMRTNGGAGTSFYVKESGSGNTGWVGK